MNRDQLPVDRGLLLWLSLTLEAERATRQLPRLVLSYEQLLQWANTVYTALVEPAAEQQRELLDWAKEVVQQKLQALLEQGLRRVMLQLFWEPEAGGGFSEAASQRRSVIAERGRATVVFQLPAGAERPRLLRLDLAEEPAMVTVLAIRLRGVTGTLIWQWPEEQTLPDQEQALPVRGVNPNTMVLPGGVVLAATADPGVVLDVAEEVLQQLEAKAELELEALWQPLPADVAKLSMESKTASYTTI